MPNHERSEVIPQFHKPDVDVFSLQPLSDGFVGN